jgi:NADPH:quinone reductase-like Zn-dependent oxidoreductase
MKAVIWNGSQAELVTGRPPPRLRPDYVLISTVAVALNPTDVKAISQGRGATDGLLGSDFAGVVLEVGPHVAKPFQKGDRVFGFAHGANSNEAEDGAWAEVIAAKGDCLMKMPDNDDDDVDDHVDGWGFEGAATAGASVLTSGQGLFLHMKLRLPNPDGSGSPGAGPAKEYVLIHGGSSSAGTLAIQYLKL